MNVYIWEEIPPLNFTANTANSTVQLTKTGSPTSVSLETSTDKVNWSSYTIGDTITLSNIGDKVYWRNTSTSTTGFNVDWSNLYKFVMSGNIAGSGDVTTLLNKNGTTTLSGYCFLNLFFGCTSLTTPPLLPATTLAQYCYRSMFYNTGLVEAPQLPATSLVNDCYSYMFYGCTSLEVLPKLPTTSLAGWCYMNMFDGCSKIKLSTTQTGEYQTPYRIPITGTGSAGTSSLTDMFKNTGGTFTGTPGINTTYYTSNTVV